MSIPTHVPPMRIFERDARSTHWQYIFPPGTLREHVLDPRVWRHVAGPAERPKLKRFDTITALAEDGSFDIELRVLVVDPQGLWAQTAILHEREPSEPMAVAASYPDKDGFTIEFSGPQLWRIRRGDDLVAEGFHDEPAAKAALARLKGSKPTEAPEAPETEGLGPDDYTVVFRGPRKFEIEDAAGNVVAEMLPTKEAALAKLAEIKAEKLAA